MFENLKLTVAAIVGVVASAIALIDGLAQKLQDALNNGADPVEIQAIIDQLNAAKTDLAEAVDANDGEEEPVEDEDEDDTEEA